MLPGSGSYHSQVLFPSVFFCFFKGKEKNLCTSGCFHCEVALDLIRGTTGHPKAGLNRLGVEVIGKIQTRMCPQLTRCKWMVPDVEQGGGGEGD